MADQNKLFVAGIAWTTTDEAFKAFFSAFGEVQDSIVMREQLSGRSRGFGFVTYTDASACEKVLGQALQLDGRKLDLKMALSKEDMNQQNGGQATQSSKKLYVAGVSFDTTEDGLFQFFSRFGDIESASIMKDKVSGRSRGFAFVTFIRETSVEAAVHAQSEAALVLDGRPLDIKAAYPRGSKELIKGPEGPMGMVGMDGLPVKLQSKKVFVAGLLPTTTDEVFRAYFEAFGKVTDAFIQKDRATQTSRGFGFVTYEQNYEAKAVLNMPKEHVIDGKSVDCKAATPRPERPDAAAMYNPMGGPAYGAGMGGGARAGAARGQVAYGGQAASMQRQQQPVMQFGGQVMGQGGAQVGQYGNGAQAAYGREQFGNVGFQQAQGYTVGGAVGYDVGADDAAYPTNGNPYGNAGNSYGAYAGAGAGRSASGRRGQSSFHPYSR